MQVLTDDHEWVLWGLGKGTWLDGFLDHYAATIGLN
jgi:hypothetical protein